EGAHLHAAAQMLAVRGHAHRFLTTGDDDIGIAVEDRLIAKRHGAQARAAQLVDAPGRALHGDARTDRGYACRVLSLPGRQNLTHDHFGHALTFDTGAVECGLDGHLAEVVSRQVRECAVERTDGRTRRADNDDIVRHGSTPCWRRMGCWHR